MKKKRCEFFLLVFPRFVLFSKLSSLSLSLSLSLSPFLTSGGADGVPTKRVKVKPLRKARSDLPRRHHRAQGQPVADPLGHRHYVRHDAVGLEAPVVLPGPPEPRLDLVGDAEAPRCAHGLVGWLQEALDEGDGLFCF